MPDPTYARHYGHAEAVEVTFDPSVLAYRSLLELFFQIHDPTTYEQQGSDVGPSYRSAIFYTTEVQKEVALTTIAEIEASGSWPGPVVSEINPEEPFGRRSQSTKNTWCAILGAIAATSCARPGGWTAQTNAQL
jgi:peptide-methionine (S)-S-oxide reductase